MENDNLDCYDILYEHVKFCFKYHILGIRL